MRCRFALLGQQEPSKGQTFSNNPFSGVSRHFQGPLQKLLPCFLARRMDFVVGIRGPPSPPQGLNHNCHLWVLSPLPVDGFGNSHGTPGWPVDILGSLLIDF